MIRSLLKKVGRRLKDRARDLFRVPATAGPTNDRSSAPLPATTSAVSTASLAESVPTPPPVRSTRPSKYAPLIEQARGLKPNTFFKVPLNGVPMDSFLRNARQALKRAHVAGVLVAKVAGDGSVVAVYRPG